MAQAAAAAAPTAANTRYNPTGAAAANALATDALDHYDVTRDNLFAAALTSGTQSRGGGMDLDGAWTAN